MTTNHKVRVFKYFETFSKSEINNIKNAQIYAAFPKIPKPTLRRIKKSYLDEINKPPSPPKKSEKTQLIEYSKKNEPTPQSLMEKIESLDNYIPISDYQMDQIMEQYMIELSESELDPRIAMTLIKYMEYRKKYNENDGEEEFMNISMEELQRAGMKTNDKEMEELYGSHVDNKIKETD
jgi:peroxiredoxin